MSTTTPRRLDGWDGSQAEYVRRYYDVPARRGGRIVFDGKPATVVGFADARLLVRLDGEEETVPIHPTWEVEYLPAEEVTR